MLQGFTLPEYLLRTCNPADHEVASWIELATLWCHRPVWLYEQSER